MSRKKLFAFLICNLVIAILEAIGLVISFSQIGATALIYYTELSNIFLFLVSVINLIFGICALKNKKRAIPKTIWNLFHAAVSATTVTFLVVLFVLSWMVGDLIYVLTHGSMLYTHTLCPILGIVSFIIFAPKVFTRKSALCAP